MNRENPNDYSHTKEQLEDMLVKMNRLSEMFYWTSVNIGCHSFIEICGLMREIINIYQNTLNNNIDFTECNVHTGKGLLIENYQIEYIAEKFTCIFGASLTEDKIKILFNAIEKHSKVNTKNEYNKEEAKAAIFFYDSIVELLKAMQDGKLNRANFEGYYEANELSIIHTPTEKLILKKNFNKQEAVEICDLYGIKYYIK